MAKKWQLAQRANSKRTMAAAVERQALRKPQPKAAIVRPDNYKCRAAEAHSEAAVCLSQGAEPPFTGLAALTVEGHLRAALALRESILLDIRDNAGMDPDIVACRGNVALAEINLARHLHGAGRVQGSDGAEAHYAVAADILEEAVPTAPVTVETAVALAGLRRGEHERALRLVQAHEAQLSELLQGALEGEGAGGGSSSGSAADFVRSVQADLAAARGWHDNVLRDWGLATLEALPWEAGGFEAVCARYRGLLEARGRPRDFGAVHALAGFLLARATGPTRADWEEAEALYVEALQDPAARQHAAYADAEFNLGVICHFRALEAESAPVEPAQPGATE